ncbi:MAG: insulinase family protein [Sphingobacteriia bacterium]|nr:insulinase family protein [Sphingobacteriia bacterium]NDC72230.1 insulinase family protein [Sphingobacteriia bacterium]
MAVGPPVSIKTSTGFTILCLHDPHYTLAHLALINDSGSRDDLPVGSGVTHCLEHLLFKGTRDRNTFQVLSELENKGGDLNAFTTKERLVLHASCPAVHSLTALDLLGDMWWHSTWSDEEFRKEQKIIREEIGMYRDNPEESLLEEFETLVFGRHALAHPILGYEEELMRLRSQEVHAYYRNVFLQRPTVLVYHGPLEPLEVKAAIERHQTKPKKSGFATHSASLRKRPSGLRQSKSLDKVQDFNQAYGMIGGRAPSVSDDNRWAIALLFNWLGGDHMSARLSMELRENLALVYEIEAQYSPYSDTGMWSIPFSCDPSNDRLVQKRVEEILHRPSLSTPTASEFKIAKEQMIGRILLAEENRLQNLIGWGQAYLDGNRLLDTQEIIDRIHRIPRTAVLDAANHLFRVMPRRSLLWTCAP